MVKYFLDTNIFLRTIVVEDDKQYQECLRLLTIIKEGQIKAVTSNEVIAEMVWVLKSYYKLTRSQIVEAVRTVVNLKGLKLVLTNNIERAIEIYEQSTVKFIDAMIASIKQIQEKKWVVVSYDKDFDKIGVLRKEPKEI